jgi:hypothetical protein
MSKVFFEELAIPAPDTNLNVGSGGHGEQTGRMLSELEALFNKTTPDAVIVYGDTNSTLAACLAAVKLHLPVAHVEAGLRSFNRAMPEEINRVATDHCADRLYAPTPTGLQNLTNENLQQRSVFTGDVMRDTVIRNLAIAGQRGAGRYASDERYGVLTGCFAGVTARTGCNSAAHHAAVVSGTSAYSIGRRGLSVQLQSTSRSRTAGLPRHAGSGKARGAGDHGFRWFAERGGLCRYALCHAER